MSTAILVAEDLGCGFWLEDGILMAGTILPDGSGFATGHRSAFPAARLSEIHLILADLEPRRDIRHPRHSLQMSGALQ